MIPGEYFLAKDDIIANKGCKTTVLAVTNTGDRPVQIGSHFHFFEVNKQLLFKRESALGYRLNIAAGTAVRFEPGEEKEIELVEIGGLKKIWGFNNLVQGAALTDNGKANAIEQMKVHNFKNMIP